MECRRAMELGSSLLLLLIMNVAASVSLPAGTAVETPHGRMVPRTTEVFDSYDGYPNGTVFFDLTMSYTGLSGELFFNVKSYGNGSFTVRFKGPEPLDFETNTTVAPVYDSGPGWLEWVFTAEQSFFLAIDFPKGSGAGLGVGPVIMAAAGIAAFSILAGVVLVLRRRALRQPRRAEGSKTGSEVSSAVSDSF